MIENEAYLLNFQSYLFPLNSEGGFLTEILYSIRGRNVQTHEDLEKYLQDLEQLPEYLQSRTQHLEQGIAQNKIMPKLIVQHCIDNIQGILDMGVDESFYLKVVQQGDNAWKDRVRTVVKEQVFPAYARLKDFLQNKYLVAAPDDIGVSSMNGGREFYQQRVRYFTTLELSPQDVFEIGQKEVNRIRKEMQQIIDQVEFDGSFKEFLEFLRTDPQFYAQSPEELLKEAAWITKKMEGLMPRYFGKLPRMPLDVVPVPSALAPNYTGGRYSPGSYQQRKPGEYWVNTYDLPSRPLYTLPALTLHEGVPGHHTQIMLAAEMENMPRFRTRTYISAFGEGWGLYAEFLGKEANIYRTPYEQFGRLTYEMWRACRLVVDPGMHFMGWSRQQAVDFMSSNTALSMREINSEIDRYIGWPGQAVSYKIGELKIKELRSQAQQQLGSAFDIRAFHDLILGQGSVPLFILEQQVLNWIQQNKQK